MVNIIQGDYGQKDWSPSSETTDIHVKRQEVEEGEKGLEAT